MKNKFIFGSEECQAHLLALMSDKEIVRKDRRVFPKAQGLWAICVREVGLLESETQVIVCPEKVQETDSMTSTVKVRVTLRPYLDRYYPLFVKSDIPEEERVISDKDKFVFEGACDIGRYNTDN
ncbi:unnamed protein product, partial [marine sediment metagenome]